MSAASKTSSDIVRHGFPLREYEGRIERAQEVMRAHAFDCLVFTTPHNIRWATGFDSQFWESPTRPWFIVLPSVGEPIAVIPEIGAQQMAATWIKDIRTWPSPRPADDGTTLIADVLQELPRRHGRVGFELGAEQTLRMPVTQFLDLRDRLTGIDLCDGARCIWSLRMVKTEAEIGKIRHICQIASEVYDHVPTLVSAGMTERDAARTVRIELAKAGADSTPFLPAISGPGGVPQIVCGPGDRALRDGDVLFFDTGSTFDGYWCDFDRNYAVGQISDDALRAHEAMWQATDAGLAAIRPGVTTDALHCAMMKVIDEARAMTGHRVASSTGRLGHGLGMQLTEPPSHMAGDGTVLLEGMVLTIEPGIAYAADKMIVHEENIVVRADGAELLTRRAPREMPRLR